jgi:hypothetical protein
MNKVEIRPAFTFTCEECGMDTFFSGLVLESDMLSVEELSQFREIHPNGEIEEFTVFKVPERVNCVHCDEEFESDCSLLD